jgi:alkylation response protein AidB-like acyl-CoA dehydrogenase
VRRKIFTAGHEAFRQLVRDFVAKEAVPHYTAWEQAGRLPREVFGKLGSPLRSRGSAYHRRTRPGRLCPQRSQDVHHRRTARRPGDRGGADIEAAQMVLDRAVLDLVDGALSGADAAKVKLFCTEMGARAVDDCLQLFGGCGYMLEYPVARLYTDARVARIYAGTSEAIEVVVAKSLGL